MNDITRIKDLPPEMRPYERCERYGTKSLTDIELIAIIIKTGCKGKLSIQLAGELLAGDDRYGGLIGLAHKSYDELVSIRGIGRVKALQIMCIIELSRRMAKASMKSEGISFNMPDAVAAYYMEDMRHKEQEEVLVLLLDTKGKLIKEVWLSKGTVNAVMAVPRDIYAEALKFSASGIIVLHNHPSGDATPSSEDYESTARIKSAGEIIGIPLIDHIIIGDNTYMSFKERGNI